MSLIKKTMILGLTGLLFLTSPIHADDGGKIAGSGKKKPVKAEKAESLKSLGDKYESLSFRLSMVEEEGKRVRELLGKIPDSEEKLQLLSDKAKVLEDKAVALSESLLKIQEERVKEKEAKAKEPGPRVDMDKASSKVKVYGRWSATYLKSQINGPNPRGTVGVPDSKLFFLFSPNEYTSILTRFSLNNAAFNSVEYFYLDYNWQKYSKTKHPLVSRIGRQRMDFGQDAYLVNLTESSVCTADAANVGGIDEALQLTGKMGGKNEFTWHVGAANGNQGTVADSTSGKSVYGRLYYTSPKPFTCSISLFNSGSMKTGLADMTFAGVASGPAKATDWSRHLAEFNCRYDWRKGKILVPTFTDSKAFIRGQYGKLLDEVLGGFAADRKGHYSTVEGLYNFNPTFFTAIRYSDIVLDRGQLAPLNGVTANKYTRSSLGFGWRMSKNVALKLAYDWNKNSGAGVTDARDNQFTSAFSSIF